MQNKKSPSCAQILALDKARLHEVDGVVMDNDSYQRYIQSKLTAEPAHAEPTPAAPAAAPAAVFAAEPVHIGWYTVENGVSVPIMAGAVQTGASVVLCTGSGSGSYLTSYLTSGSYLSSYYTSGSYLTSYLMTSGSSSGMGGYGLGLI